MAKRTAATIGLHGDEALGNLYRYGVLTVPELCRLTGLSETTAKRQLGYLVDAGLVARARDVAGWRGPSTGRPRTAYYLTSPAGAKAGAFALGIENDYLALRHYRRVRATGTVSHRLLANEYLLSVPGAEEVFSESCPDFPLFGKGTPKSDRADSPHRYARIVPDGVFVLDSRSYYVEVETKPYGRPELVSKIVDYGGRWRRMLAPNPGERKFHDPNARLEPVVLLTPGTEAAERLQEYLQRRLPEEAEWAGAAETIRAASAPDEAGKSKATPGMLVLITSMEEVQKDPLRRAYRPLRPYPKALSEEDGWRVSLKDAAAISDKIKVPERPPKLAKPKRDNKKKTAKGAV